ncbi:MAG: hypothetical protein WC655_13595, partial [Candidatus Hydrogenedentales bacterium]
IAEAESIPLVDIYRIFTEHNRQHPEQPLLLDGMHPNDWGHRLIADHLVAVISDLLEETPAKAN